MVLREDILLHRMFKLLKLRSIEGQQLKRYLLYALGEVLLVVIGILIALYINNSNASSRYEKQIDSGFERAYAELESNIASVRNTIEKIRRKDSLIYLVMYDSLTPEQYVNNVELAYLILYYHNFTIEDKAFQNLISLNVSDNQYQEELLAQLKELYALNETIKSDNKQMSSFVYDKSLPHLAENTQSFGDLTYKGLVSQDVIDYMISSNAYKSFVSQYAIIAIKNQLRYDEIFLKEALSLQSAIAEDYKLTIDAPFNTDSLLLQHGGQYYNEVLRDTLVVKAADDKIVVARKEGFELGLIPISKQHFFTDNEGGGYFVSFYQEGETPVLKLNLLATKYVYERL